MITLIIANHGQRSLVSNALSFTQKIVPRLRKQQEIVGCESVGQDQIEAPSPAVTPHGAPIFVLDLGIASGRSDCRKLSRFLRRFLAGMRLE